MSTQFFITLFFRLFTRPIVQNVLCVPVFTNQVAHKYREFTVFAKTQNISGQNLLRYIYILVYVFILDYIYFVPWIVCIYFSSYEVNKTPLWELAFSHCDIWRGLMFPFPVWYGMQEVDTREVEVTLSQHHRCMNQVCDWWKSSLDRLISSPLWVVGQ